MPSHLNGLRKTLTWADFGTPVSKPAPTPGHTAIGAHTETAAPLSYGWRSSGHSVTIQDDVVVDIRFVANQSWAATWVFNQPQRFQNDLLKHEQGHYDITALMARDMFIDLMHLKTQTFHSHHALVQAVKAVQHTYRLQRVHNKYDAASETKHGMNAMPQAAWNALLHQAWTVARTPAMSAPDGTPYKVRLLDVLQNAGKSP
jgi:hypothetical protein